MMKIDKYKRLIKNTFFILVLYKIKLNESFSFQSLTNICEGKHISLDLLIHDNSPETMIKNKIYGSKYINLRYIHDKTNPGISKAYNIGYQIAKKLQKKWLLLLDQDTWFNDNMLMEYAHAIENHPEVHLFAPILTDQGNILSPCHYYLKRGFPIKNIQAGIHSLKKLALLNSAMLVTMVAFKKSGGYDEKIKLDFADFDFQERLKKHYPDFFLINYHCEHTFFSYFKNNQHEATVRYQYFCNSAVHFAKSLWDFIILMCWTLLRGFKLSFQYKNFIFIILFIKFFLFKKELL